MSFKLLVCWLIYLFTKYAYIIYSIFGPIKQHVELDTDKKDIKLKNNNF